MFNMLPDFNSMFTQEGANLNKLFITASADQDKKILKVIFVSTKGDIFPLNAADMLPVKVSPHKAGERFELVLDAEGNWLTNKAVLPNGETIEVLFSTEMLSRMVIDGSIIVREFS